MVVAVIVLAAVAVLAVALWLRAQRAASKQRAEATELRSEQERREASQREDRERAEAADRARTAAEEARRRAEADRYEAVVARSESDAARASAEKARERAEADFEDATRLAATLTDDGSADPGALWALERLRSERTWTQSVAIPGQPSPLADLDRPLVPALEIESAAVREETGAVVHLEVDLPDDLSSGASLATLRAAQEVLAASVDVGDDIVLRVSRAGDDVLVTSEVRDDERPVEPISLRLPPSRIEAVPGGIVLRGVLTAPATHADGKDATESPHIRLAG